MTDISRLTESEAFDLYFQLRARFDWCGSPTAMGDVPVNWVDKDNDDEEPELTDAMREAVLETYEWRKAIDERCSEVANNMVPSIEVFPNGDFLLHTESAPSVRYAADGSEL